MKPIALRTKLTFLYTSILALFLVARAVAGYYSLARQLDASITEELVERSAGLRGYLKVTDASVTFTHDEHDPEEALFIETATRLFQIYRLRDGHIVAQSPEMRALGLRMTPAELSAFTTGHEIREIKTTRET